MIKITSIEEVDKILHLPENIQKSVQRTFKQVEDANLCEMKSRIILIVEAKDELNDIQQLGIKEQSVLPKYGPYIFCNRIFMVFSILLDNKTQLIYYIPIEYLED